VAAGITAAELSLTVPAIDPVGAFCANVPGEMPRIRARIHNTTANGFKQDSLCKK
jgi:hypothetical protein